MNIIYHGPNKEHLFSLECEDGSIGIENPEVLKGFDINGVGWSQIENSCKPNDTFPPPDGLAVDIEYQKHADGEWIKCPLWQYENREDGFRRQVIHLKLKSLPEKGAGDDYPVIEQNQDDDKVWHEMYADLMGAVSGKLYNHVLLKLKSKYTITRKR